jgi:hypothetical protein
MRTTPGLLASLLIAACAGGAGPAPKPAPRGQAHALLVGVCDYEHSALIPLRYTENDVEELARLLDRPGSPFHNNVRVLSCSRGKKDPAGRPTAANLRQALGALLKSRTRHELVLLALSGHGVQLEVPDPDGKERPRSHGFFCPSDAQLSGVDFRTGRHPRLVNVADLLRDLGDCGAGVKLVLMDACRNELRARSRSLSVSREMVPDGVCMLFSCKTGAYTHTSSRGESGPAVQPPRRRLDVPRQPPKTAAPRRDPPLGREVRPAAIGRPGAPQTAPARVVVGRPLVDKTTRPGRVSPGPVGYQRGRLSLLSVTGWRG